MVPTQSLENFPIFGDNATKVKPDDAKYAAGFQPADVYPAEWVNYVWNKSSSGVTKLNAGVDMMEQEINNVLAGADKTPDATKNNQLLEAIQKLITDAETRAKLAAHPIGSLYWSKQSTDPATLFGGTWSRVKDKFILAAGDTYAQGATGGAATVTLDTTKIPSHSHTLNGHTHKVTAAGSISVTTNPTFTGIEHSHSYTPAGSISVTTNPTFTPHSNQYTDWASAKHKHQINKGNTSSSGTTQTAGFRGTAVTSGGCTTTQRGSIVVQNTGFKSASGLFSLSTDSISSATGSGTSGKVTANLDITAHYHNVTATGFLYGYTDNSDDSEQAEATTTTHQHKFSPTGAISGGAYKFTGTAATLKATQGGNISGGAYSFTGSEVTSGGNSGNTSSTGGGGAHENMPPYVAYYCWERVS